MNTKNFKVSSFRRHLLSALCAAGLGVGALSAQAAETSDWTLVGNSSLVSNYIFRGVSQTQNLPTWQVTMELDHKSGWYVGTFGSGVSHAAYNNSNGAEIDLFGGYRYTLSDTSNLDMGLVTYWYPGAHSSDGYNILANTQEYKLGYNNGTFNATGWVSPTNSWFGLALDPVTGERVNTAGTYYLEANWNPALNDAWALNLHAGAQRFQGLSVYNFNDYKVGVTKTDGKWAYSAAVTFNDGVATKGTSNVWVFSDADGSARSVAGTHALLSATYNY